MTRNRFAGTLKKWQDSLRVESVITKSTHFVALTEYPRNSPHRAAWVSSLSLFLALSVKIEEVTEVRLGLCGVRYQSNRYQTSSPVEKTFYPPIALVQVVVKVLGLVHRVMLPTANGGIGTQNDQQNRSALEILDHGRDHLRPSVGAGADGFYRRRITQTQGKR